MKIPLLARSVGIGLVAVAIVVAFAYWLNRGSQVRLEGSILKVRTISTDDEACIAVIDFRVKNPARTLFLVKEVTLSAVLDDGSTMEGKTVPEIDLDRVLEYYKTAGPRFNPVLKQRDKIVSESAVDRTASASFNVAERRIQSRRNLKLLIHDADGAVVRLSER